MWVIANITILFALIMISVVALEEQATQTCLPWSTPVYWFAQNSTHLLLSVKFSVKISGLAQTTTKVSHFQCISDPKVTEWGYANKRFKGNRGGLILRGTEGGVVNDEEEECVPGKRYALDIPLWGAIVQSSCEWKSGSAGRVTVTIMKEDLEVEMLEIDEDEWDEERAWKGR
ncbi:hypothetical protein TrLO_g15480 [Triparma laevis f. longispina]|nr:hypothetical protein TrLO_g15480 [Triparma laevis f. longispina]